MSLSITAAYAAPLAILMLVLWFNVTRTRADLNVSIGDAGDAKLHEHIRRHGNFMEWVPFVLLMMALAEAQGLSAGWLHATGGILLVSRLLHPFGLKAAKATHPLRIIGNSGSILALLIPTVALARATLGL